MGGATTGGMKRLLTALDASRGASDVLRAAVDVASAAGASVSVLRVVEGAGERPESNEALASAARAELRELARSVPASRIASVLASTGVPWRDICDVARTDDVDLVVIGARRYGVVERTLGTTSTKVVAHCDRSVLVVRRWHGPPKRVVVALDDSARRALVREHAVEFARYTGAKVRLFHAFDMPPVVPADMLGEFPTIEHALRDAAGKLLGDDERLVPPDLLDGTTARHGAVAWQEICAAAQEYDADLIVVGARGQGLAEHLLGTTALQVVRHADRSVLVVRRAPNR